MFIVADNNRPWICFAKNEDSICYWVMVCIGLLATVTVFSILFFQSSAALVIVQSCLKLPKNQAEWTT